VVIRFLLGIVFLAVMTTGCATTGAKNQEQLQTRVTELEKKVEQKDSEIVDLQYQVKDISTKVF
jgi:cell division protein FtsL